MMCEYSSNPCRQVVIYFRSSLYTGLMHSFQMSYISTILWNILIIIVSGDNRNVHFNTIPIILKTSIDSFEYIILKNAHDI